MRKDAGNASMVSSLFASLSTKAATSDGPFLSLTMYRPGLAVGGCGERNPKRFQARSVQIYDAAAGYSELNLIPNSEIQIPKIQNSCLLILVRFPGIYRD
jgi:hypothetical protein